MLNRRCSAAFGNGGVAANATIQLGEFIMILVIHEDKIYEMATINSDIYRHHKLNICR
jgi:enolase